MKRLAAASFTLGLIVALTLAIGYRQRHAIRNYFTASPPAIPVSSFSDYFVSAPGTGLTSTGQWSTRLLPYDLLVSNAHRAYCTDVAAILASVAVPASADYSVSADVYVASLANGTQAGVVGRCDASGNQRYQAVYDVSAGAWKLDAIIGGSGAGGVTYTQALAAGQSYRVELRMAGTSIKMFIDGIERGSLTDSQVTAAGTGGMVIVGGGATSGLHMTGYQQTDAADAFFAASNAAVFASPQWYVPSYARANNVGAYLKTTFTGPRAAVLIDPTQLALAGIASNNCPVLTWSVDNGPYQSQQLSSTTRSVTLATGLADTSHTLTLHFSGTQYTIPRWADNGGGPVNSVIVNGIVTAAGKTLAAPTLRPNRLAVFGDSITEGINDVGSGYNAASQNSLYVWGSYLAASLEAEYSIVGFGSQSYDQAGDGGVPAFWTGGTWSNLWQGRPHDLSPYTHIALFHGTGTNGTVNAAHVASHLTATRAANPTAILLQILPTTTGNHPAITQGFNDFKASGDTRSYLITLPVTEGMTTINRPTTHYTDNIHPNVIGHAWIGAQASQEAAKAIATGGLTARDVTDAVAAYFENSTPEVMLAPGQAESIRAGLATQGVQDEHSEQLAGLEGDTNAARAAAEAAEDAIADLDVSLSPDDLAAITAAVQDGISTGAIPISVTVTSSATGAAVQNASVRYVASGLTAAYGITDASGVRMLGLSAGTFTRTITAAGFNGRVDTINVAGPTATAVMLVPLQIETPTAPPVGAGFAN